MLRSDPQGDVGGVGKSVVGLMKVYNARTGTCFMAIYRRVAEKLFRVTTCCSGISRRTLQKHCSTSAVQNTSILVSRGQKYPFKKICRFPKLICFSDVLRFVWHRSSKAVGQVAFSFSQDTTREKLMELLNTLGWEHRWNCLRFNDVQRAIFKRFEDVQDLRRCTTFFTCLVTLRQGDSYNSLSWNLRRVMMSGQFCHLWLCLCQFCGPFQREQGTEATETKQSKDVGNFALG